MKTKFLMDNVNRFNERIYSIGGCKLNYWSNLIYCAIRFGSSPDDYFRYEFYKKSNYERNRFITFKRSQKLIKTYNHPEHIIRVLDKGIFNKYFAKYIKREWIDTSSCSFDDFLEFINKHKKVIIKPINSSEGRGIGKYEKAKNKIDSLKSTFLKIKGVLIEEIINQHEVLNALNNSSVNTVRILTFMPHNNPHIIGCSLRMGINGSIVDNLHSGGLCAGIDLKTGIVFTPAINSKLNKFLRHPDSGEKIIGLEIPYWDELINTVKEAALLLPELKYLGWDFAILGKSVALIEANHNPAHDLSQIADQQGKYEILLQLMHPPK